jgi:hypothetical protein
LQAILQRIEAATAAARRPAGSVALIAVSKTFPAAAIEAAHAAGQRAFGENYVQEALAKMAELEARRALTSGADRPLEWHMIGPIQSNKTRAIAEHFDWVHSVDRLAIAERLARHRPAHLAPLNLCLQVNISGEATKSGVAPEQLPALARAVSLLPGVRLRGLMGIPEPAPEPTRERSAFAALRVLRDVLREAQIGVDELSMGMSADLEPAILEGATMVRVGTALFGVRHAV